VCKSGLCASTTFVVRRDHLATRIALIANYYPCDADVLANDWFNLTKALIAPELVVCLRSSTTGIRSYANQSEHT
jgi:hypothetical protein